MLNKTDKFNREAANELLSAAPSANPMCGSEVEEPAENKHGKLVFEFPTFEEFGKGKRSYCFSSLT